MKAEIYYDKVYSQALRLELWGLTTYEFEKSTNNYYGLDNLNDSWLALYNIASKNIEFLILSKRPLGLAIRADENELIDQIELTLEKGTFVYAGQLTYDDLNRDTDGDGIPDWLEETVSVANIVLQRDYGAW